MDNSERAHGLTGGVTCKCYQLGSLHRETPIVNYNCLDDMPDIVQFLCRQFVDCNHRIQIHDTHSVQNIAINHEILVCCIWY